MEKNDWTAGGVSCLVYAQPAPRVVLLQPVDEHDRAGMDREMEALSGAAPVPFLLAAFPVQDWFRDLSPWPAPPAFGKQAFGAGAADTLRLIRETLLPGLKKDFPLPPAAPCLLGGYSLAGLFALWCGHETDLFSGIAAASPSVWFPGWMDYAAAHVLRAERVYLSLGDREEKTRNPLMAAVGDNIRRQYDLFRARTDLASTLYWNEGNHFRDPDLRMARGFLWLMQSGQKP